MSKLPNVHFVNRHTGKPVDLAGVVDNDEDDNDQPLAQTPPDVIAMLGFDPLKVSEEDVKHDKKPDLADLIDIAADPKHEVYKFTGSRGVALTTTKRGKTVDAGLRNGDMFGVRPSSRGPDWAIIVLHKVGDFYSFAVTAATLRRILNHAKRFVKESDKKATPSHLLQMSTAWREAPPEGMGSRKSAPFYVVAKFANIHKGISVKPSDLVVACAHVEHPTDVQGMKLKELQAFMMAVHRGLRAMIQLFKTKLTGKQLGAVAAYIKNPSTQPSPKVANLLSAHDARWRPEDKQYVKRRG